MRILLRFGSILTIAVKRLLAQWRLTLLTILGLTVAVSLALSVPLYADAVYGRTLSRALLDQNKQGDAYPPFAILFRQLASGSRPAKWATVQAVDAYLGQQAPDGQVGAQFGLPAKQRVRFLRSDMLSLYPADTTAERFTLRNRLGIMTIGAAQRFEDHVTLTEGRFPAAKAPAGQPIDVLVSAEQATKLGLQIDETYLLAHPDNGAGGTPLLIPVRIAGIWTARDPADEYWFYKPWALTDTFMVPDATYTEQLVPLMRDPVQVAVWYVVLDGSRVTASDAGMLAQRIRGVAAEVAGLMPGLTLTVSPLDALARFERAATLLTIQLLAFSVPILGLILVFIALVAGLTVGEQRNEIAVLRSRGATTAQVVGIAALEALLLNTIALALAWPLSEFFASVIGRTRSFLIFDASSDVHIHMTPSTLRFGLVMAGLAFVIQLMPTFAAARHTIISYKQERARSLRPPLWQRLWLDVLLLIATGYGIYLLGRQGAIGELPLAAGAQLPSSSMAVQPNDPFQNPLLFLVPAMGVFALTLLVLRALPLLTRAVVWVVARTRSTGFLLAIRHLARSPGLYTAPLLLLVLTLSLSAFTASLATTLDHHLRDKSYYTVGADLDVDELGQHPMIDDPTGSRSIPEEDTQRWLLPPVTDHLRVPGVQAAARVGRYSATLLLNGNRINSTFIGLDRATFPTVTFWRRDFAQRSLGALMNLLAADPAATLAPRKYLKEYGLKVGDTVRAEVSSFGDTVELELRIVGEFELFPSWFPDSGPLFVGNLDYYFEQLGYTVPYHVWLRTGAVKDHERIVKGLQGSGLYVVNWDAPLRVIADEQRRPERQGLFGVLSIGFVAAALLTIVGFLLYAFFSLRRRTIELGILRAIGLSAGQMTSFVGWELAFLIGIGLAVGTVMGAWISGLFIPYLQVGSGPDARVPPFLVEIAWPAVFRIYALFGLLFVIALVVLAALLRRMKINQAIKLGETV